MENPGTSARPANVRERATEGERYQTANGLIPDTISRSYIQLSQDAGLLEFSRLSITSGPLRNHTEDVFCKFYLDQTFSFGTWSNEIQNNRQWMYEILQSPSKNPVSLPAFRCLITGFFGHAQRDANLKAQAAKMYSQAIIALKRGLESEGQERSSLRPFPSFQLLSATMLLLQYEYLAVTPPKGWIRHASGLETLVKLRGPGYFKRAGSRQRALLKRAKISLQMESMRAYKSCFLDLPEWRAIWADNEEAQEQYGVGSDGDVVSESLVSLNQDLTDITAGLSAVFEDVKRLKDMDLDGRSMRYEVSRLTECQDSLIGIEDDLRQWWESCSSDVTKLPVVTAVETSDKSQISTFSGTFLSFGSLTATHDFCRYHAYNILIMMWLNRIRSLFPRDSGNKDNESTLSRAKPFPPIATPSEYVSADHPNVVRALSHARAICDALPMYTLPQYRYIGGLWAAFPARLAWQVFPASSKEALWLRTFLDKVADASGFEINRHICRPL